MKADDLKEGLKVWVHPTPNSQTNYSFESYIVKKEINWTSGPKIEWCVYVPGSHGAVINEYLLKRIEINEN